MVMPNNKQRQNFTAPAIGRNPAGQGHGGDGDQQHDNQPRQAGQRSALPVSHVDAAQHKGRKNHDRHGHGPHYLVMHGPPGQHGGVFEPEQIDLIGFQRLAGLGQSVPRQGMDPSPVATSSTAVLIACAVSLASSLSVRVEASCGRSQANRRSATSSLSGCLRRLSRIAVPSPISTSATLTICSGSACPTGCTRISS